MGFVTIKGQDKMREAFQRMIDRTKSQLYDLRAQIAMELTLALVKNIPVWSGRTISSLTWAPQQVQNAQPHPQRGGYAINGMWHADPTYGKTQMLPLGAEKMRGSAEAQATSEAESLYGYFGDVAVMTINSVPWGLIEHAQAPGGSGQRPRNTAVVSQLALQQVKSKFGNVLKN